MTNFAITGSLGEGKGIIACMQIQEYLRQGRRVITNIDLKLEKLLPVDRPLNVLRCSDFPSSDEFESFGVGHDVYDQKKFGGIFLDETLIMFNSRDYGDKDRPKIIKWMRHARKRRWDFFALMQDFGSLDKQMREAIFHNEVVCRAGDKMTIPFIGGFWKALTGHPLTLPPFHLAIVKSVKLKGLRLDSWFTRGTEFYGAYDTMQEFMGNVNGMSCVLDVYRAPYLQRPQTRAMARYDAFHALVECFPRLRAWLPDEWLQPPPELVRHVDFLVAERDGPPVYQPSTHKSFEEWARDNPKRVREPLREAA